MSIKPINYNLRFEPDLERFVFNGVEIITVTCTSNVKKITMDCAEIEISSCHVECGGKLIPCTYATDKSNEEFSIFLDEKIKGEAIIHVEFLGTLNDRLLGFYRSKYEVNGVTKHLATTQFEAADARRAFPCWDEPMAKATFEISILADKQFTAISNMPVSSKKKVDKDKKVLYQFAKTPAMSTYLVYLGVGEFEHIAGRVAKTQIRVITTEGNKSRGRYSLELGKKLLKSYEDYFGIPYPLPKLDLIAIPDFAAGAMENWGAITFRETILLYDPKTSSTRTKQFIAEVISHEIAHQWFGNLVTMKWWNDLWLNESFATFMATKFVDIFYPEWDMWSQFVDDAMVTAMGIDALKTTHPIDVKVRSPAEIREIFDAISYDKGGCILRMLEHYVGEPNFQKGLKQYLSDFKYGNAEGKDLWNAIGKAADMPVASMVRTWLKQPGFPLVHVMCGNGNALKISQSRYLLENNNNNDTQDNDRDHLDTTSARWHIPLSLESYGNVAFNLKKESQQHQLLVKKKSTTVRVSNPDNGGGFVVNPGRTGFYRVMYDDSMLATLKPLVQEKTIPSMDRWAIQNDLFSLCVSSADKPVMDYLNFSDAYVDEESYMASLNVTHNLSSLYFGSFDEDFSVIIKKYTTRHLRTILDRVGWDVRKTDSHTDGMLRATVISALGRMNDPHVTDEVHKRYVKFLESPESLQPDLIEPICSIAAWNGNTKTYRELIQQYRDAKTTEEQLRFLSAMCGFQNTRLLSRTLNFSQSDEVRSQNMQLPIMKVAANPHGKKILWKWLQKNWVQLHKKVGSGNPLLNRIVASIGLVVDDSMEAEIIQFFKDNPAPGTERTQAQMYERVRIHSALLRKMRVEFKDG